MIIVYTPEGGEPEHYDASAILVSEATIVSRALDMKWVAIRQGVDDEEPEPMRGIVWILKKRHEPTLRYSDFDPGVSQMVTRLDKREVRNYVTEAVAVAALNPAVTPDDIRFALREVPPIALDPEHALAVIDEVIEAASDPKDDPAPEASSLPSDPSPTSSPPASATSDASPTS